MSFVDGFGGKEEGRHDFACSSSRRNEVIALWTMGEGSTNAASGNDRPGSNPTALKGTSHTLESHTFLSNAIVGARTICHVLDNNPDAMADLDQTSHTGRGSCETA